MSVVSVEILGVTLAGVGALGAICTAIIQRFPLTYWFEPLRAVPQPKNAFQYWSESQQQRFDDEGGAIAARLLREGRAQESNLLAGGAGDLMGSPDQQGIKTLISQVGIFPVATQSVVSTDLVDESLALVVAVQSAEIVDIELLLQLQRRRTAASGILERNAVVGY